MRDVIIACGAKKRTGRCAASEMYTGGAWDSWRRHAPADGALPAGWRLWVLSAEHGLIPAWTTIDPYDRQLTPARIDALVGAVAAQWARRDATWPLTPSDVVRARGPKAPECVVIGGELYQRLALLSGLPVVESIDGRPGGIGQLRERTGRWACALRVGLGQQPGDCAELWPPRRRSSR